MLGNGADKIRRPVNCNDFIHLRTAEKVEAIHGYLDFVFFSDVQQTRQMHVHSAQVIAEDRYRAQTPSAAPKISAKIVAAGEFPVSLWSNNSSARERSGLPPSLRWPLLDEPAGGMNRGKALVASDVVRTSNLQTPDGVLISK